jgi:hypothetical protein
VLQTWVAEQIGNLSLLFQIRATAIHGLARTKHSPVDMGGN